MQVPNTSDMGIMLCFYKRLGDGYKMAKESLPNLLGKKTIRLSGEIFGPDKGPLSEWNKEPKGHNSANKEDNCHNFHPGIGVKMQRLLPAIVTPFDPLT